MPPEPGTPRNPDELNPVVLATVKLVEAPVNPEPLTVVPGAVVATEPVTGILLLVMFVFVATVPVTPTEPPVMFEFVATVLDTFTDEGLAVVCVIAAPLAIVHPAVPDNRLTPVKLTDVVPV